MPTGNGLRTEPYQFTTQSGLPVASRGPSPGGTELFIIGHFLYSHDLTVLMVGNRVQTLWTSNTNM